MEELETALDEQGKSFDNAEATITFLTAENSHHRSSGEGLAMENDVLRERLDASDRLAREAEMRALQLCSSVARSSERVVGAGDYRACRP